MALYYLETSALVKLYIREPGTDRMLRLAARPGNHRLVVLALSVVEFRCAIRRREQAGDVDESLAKQLLDRFGHHLENRFIRQVLNDSLIDIACGLADRYPLRAYDAIQLAGCLALRASAGHDAPIFVSSDRRLIEAAESEGLSSLDPNPHPN